MCQLYCHAKLWTLNNCFKQMHSTYPYSVVQYKQTNFNTHVDNQLLNKPFKLLTASTQNDNALEYRTILNTQQK